uniref:PQQ-dependent sugar dehydrogenase n=1 Tax=Nocardioides sp. TaxID=35761 RepID=UPI003562ECBD
MSRVLVDGGSGLRRFRRPTGVAFLALGGVLSVLPALTPAQAIPAQHDGDHAERHVDDHSDDRSDDHGDDHSDDHGDGTAASVPDGFQDRLAIGNLSEPTALAFAPDGTAFIALKTGVIKAVDYDPSTRQFEPYVTSNDFADLSDQVHNYWDRGLTGITLDPAFGQSGHNYVYVNYSYNRDPRDVAPVVPKWETGQGQYDGCADPAAMPEGGDPAVEGCVVTTRVSRLTATKGPDGWIMTGSEHPLLEAGCMQFQSHVSGDVRIGPDGLLYASAGDGASFDVEDLGQAGNPCGDPNNEGGALRSQDARTGGDDLGLNGAIYRLNPTTGAAPDGSGDNSARLVAYGQRNPWRFTFRPGTAELWSVDVGSSGYEEINRLHTGALSTPVNRGWPCYEGRVGASVRNPAWDAIEVPICEGLYAAGQPAVQAPAFAYRTRGGGLTPGERCESTTGSISGVAFVPPQSNYPRAFRRALFFSDYARTCIWRLGKKADGSPDPRKVSVFAQGASTPVDLMAGPGGDLFYVDYGLNAAGVPQPQAGAIRRITYRDPTPLASIVADRAAAPLSHRYRFSAARSTDPKGRTLRYSWDLDGNGTFETKTGRKPTVRKRFGSARNVLVSV